VPVLLGWVFQNAITDMLFEVANIGKFGVPAVDLRPRAAQHDKNHEATHQRKCL
jgi:hypothetical protein